MSELQWALLAAIVVLVLLVLIYNRWQEAKYRREIRQSFAGAESDVLVDGKKPAMSSRTVAERIDPQMGDLTVSQDDMSDDALDLPSVSLPVMKANAEEDRNSREGSHPQVDSIAVILAEVAVTPSQYGETVKRTSSLGKGVIWEGLEGGQWLPLTEESQQSFRELRVALQLADRQGALDVGTISQFDDLVTQFAQYVGGVSQREPVEAAEKRAQLLDAFCAETDIEIAVNIIGRNGVTFAQTKVRGLAEANGMIALASGEYALIDENGAQLYLLRNFDENEGPAIRRSQGGGYLGGLTFALDVPRTADAARVFERMVMVAMRFADVLQGEMVDDNRRPLTVAGRQSIVGTINGIVSQMKQRDIPAGSPAALRLYH